MDEASQDDERPFFFSSRLTTDLSDTETKKQEFPTLVLKIEDYTYPDGRTVPLLVADGTLPVYYLGVKYNIPVALWLGERYPRTAPTLYVRPTAAMVLKPRHALVDGSGLVSTPYLTAWDGDGARPGGTGLFGGRANNNSTSGGGGGGGSSNLVDLCHDTSIRFGADPPLFSKPPGWTGDEAADVAAAASATSSGGGSGGNGGAQQQQQQSPAAAAAAAQQQHPEFCNPIHGPSPSSSGGGGGGGGGGGIWGGALAAMAAAVAGRPPPSQSGGGGGGAAAAAETTRPAAAAAATSTPNSTATSAELLAAFRSAATAGLSARLRGSLSAASELHARAAEAEFPAREELRGRAARLAAGIEGLRAERASLEAAAAAFSSQNKALEAWLSDAEAKMPAEWRKKRKEEAERRRRREKERETAARATSAGGDAAAENEEGSDDEPEDTIEPPPALSAEDADAAIEPADALSAQALATQAEDMAVEDALYALDGALAAGALTSEPYLRAVRRLCSRQYSLRALGAKVAERQHALAAEAAEAGAAAAARAAATNRPSPPPPSSSSAAAAAPGVEMPQGDSWCSSGVLSNPLAATTANRGLGSGRRR